MPVTVKPLSIAPALAIFTIRCPLTVFVPKMNVRSGPFSETRRIASLRWMLVAMRWKPSATCIVVPSVAAATASIRFVAPVA